MSQMYKVCPIKIPLYVQTERSDTFKLHKSAIYVLDKDAVALHQTHSNQWLRVSLIHGNSNHFPIPHNRGVINVESYLAPIRKDRSSPLAP